MVREENKEPTAKSHPPDSLLSINFVLDGGLDKRSFYVLMGTQVFGYYLLKLHRYVYSKSYNVYHEK